MEKKIKNYNCGKSDSTTVKTKKIPKDLNNNSMEEIKVSKKNPLTFGRVFKFISVNCISLSLRFVIGILIMHFAGMESSHYINVVGLWFPWNNLFFLPLEAFLEAIGILGAKYFGAGKYEKFGLNTNRVRLLSFILSLFLIPINSFLPQLILPFITTQPEDTINDTVKLIQYTSISLILELQNYACLSYFETQIFLMPLFIYSVVCILTTILLLSLFLHVLQLGVTGIIIYSNLNNIIQLLLNCYFLFFQNPNPESNIIWDRRTLELKPLWKVFKIGFLNMISNFTEIITTQTTNILASRMDPYFLSMNGIIYSLQNFLCALGEGWKKSLIVLIGTFIGKNKPKLVRRSIKYASYLALIICIPIFILIFVFKFEILKFFTNELTIMYNNETSSLLTLCCFFILAEFVHMFFLGIIRGFSEVQFNSIAATIIFSIISPLLMITLFFNHVIGYKGILFISIMSFTLAAIIWLGYFLFFIDIDSYMNNSLNIPIEEEVENLKLAQ